MQIGTGNNRLPGSASTAEEAAATATAPVAPAAPPPVLRPPPRPRRRLSARDIFLVVVLLLIVAAIALVVTGRAPKVEDVQPLLTRLVAMVPRMTAASPTNTVVLTPPPRKMVSEYSPVAPINETKRVKALAHNRVAETEADKSSNLVATASNSAAMGKPPPPPPPPVETKPVEAKPVATKDKPSAGATTLAAARVIAWPELQVSAAIGGANAKWVARINGQLLRVGDKVENTTVVSISTDHVTLEFSGEQRNYLVGSKR